MILLNDFLERDPTGDLFLFFIFWGRMQFFGLMGKISLHFAIKSCEKQEYFLELFLIIFRVCGTIYSIEAISLISGSVVLCLK